METEISGERLGQERPARSLPDSASMTKNKLTFMLAWASSRRGAQEGENMQQLSNSKHDYLLCIRLYSRLILCSIFLSLFDVVMTVNCNGARNQHIKIACPAPPLLASLWIL